jgi:hypothetical protein
MQLLCAACGVAVQSAALRDTGLLTLRLGYFPNLTHAPALVGLRKGFFAASVGSDVTLETNRFQTDTTGGGVGIEILRFEHTFYCSACREMASTRTCPHPKEKHQTLSGTAVRKPLDQGRDLPPEFTRPGVARVLLDATRQEATA